MQHQDGQIPPELSEQWDAVQAELYQASRELENANKRYSAAILARILLSEQLRGRD